MSDNFRVGQLPACQHVSGDRLLDKKNVASGVIFPYFSGQYPIFFIYFFLQIIPVACIALPNFFLSYSNSESVALGGHSSSSSSVSQVWRLQAEKGVMIINSPD